jgi:MFS-type transporter involved in bile tolerance (Atg22 family)
MLNLSCNIESNERVTRLIIGAVALVGGLIGLGRWFLMLIGIVLIVEAFIGWCGIPMLAEKFKLNDLFKKKE